MTHRAVLWSVLHVSISRGVVQVENLPGRVVCSLVSALMYSCPVCASDKPQLALVEASKVGDLEAEATPESIMLSTMTEEGEKERTDREMVVPWLKFLWETYRAVLDILKTNSKLEHVYHATCIKAFNFCR